MTVHASRTQGASPSSDGGAPIPAAEPDVAVARLHLRVGMLRMAHAELEELEARGALDADGRLALAEARWRTGDLEAAAEAASAYLRSGGDAPVAHVISAEWAAAIGRPGEARAAIERLGSVDAATLDAIFAGMPRRAFWPAAPNAAVETDTLFDAERPRGRPAVGAPSEAEAGAGGGAGSTARSGGAAGVGPDGRSGDIAAGGSTGQAAREAGAMGPGAAGSTALPEPGLWDARSGSSMDETPPAHHSDPSAQMELAKAELATDPASGTLRLALVLRQDPTLAPAVLEAVAARRGPVVDVLRGDAQRLLGRHLEAEASYAAAAVGVDAEARERA